MVAPEHRHSILVVEDDEDVRRGVAQALGREGCDVLPAGSADEALGRLRAGFEPCVVLLDLMMPGMNGWQFLEARRAHPESAAVPVVVVSAYGSAAGVRAAGAADYLHKPVALDALVAVVGRHCARNGTRGA